MAIDHQPRAHEHVFLGSRHEENARRTTLVVGLTMLMMVGEIIAGTIFNSMALLADGFHMATHAVALGVAALAYRYAKRHARDPAYSFGTGKVGDLAGFASALILAVVALGIGAESVMRLLSPRHVAFTEATFVAALGLAVNVVSALVLGGGHSHGHDHHHNDYDHGHHNEHEHEHGGEHEHHGGAAGTHQDNNMRAAVVHVLADALTSVLAIAALLSGRYLGWTWLDPVMGIVGACVILAWSRSLMRSASRVLLDRTDRELSQEVSQAIEQPGDAHLTDLHVWRIGPDAHAAIVSVRTSCSTEELRRRLAAIHELAHVTVEVGSHAQQA